MTLMILAAAAPANGGLRVLVKDTAETFAWTLGLFLSQVISFVMVALALRQFAYRPLLKVLQERRDRIAEGLANADKIKQQLAEAEQRHAEILTKANAEAQKMIDHARESAGVVADKKMQEAVASAEQIIAKAREASALEYDRSMDQL